MKKPEGTHRCLVCGKEWDGTQLHQDPTLIGGRWTCGDIMCGGSVSKVSSAKQPTQSEPHIGEFSLLPPPLDYCQTCAVQHEPHEPHNQQSLFYHYVFFNEHGRWPTWADAMAHCTEEVQALWTAELANFGVVVEQPSTEEES